MEVYVKVFDFFPFSADMVRSRNCLSSYVYVGHFVVSQSQASHYALLGPFVVKHMLVRARFLMTGAFPSTVMACSCMNFSVAPCRKGLGVLKLILTLWDREEKRLKGQVSLYISVCVATRACVVLY